MDNPLTPNKIRLLLNLAEDSSAFTIPRRLLLNEEAISLANQAALSKSTINCESSSGILDLERIEGFGESGIGNESLSRSTAAFNPGEMTGRSTGADEVQLIGRRSTAFDTIKDQMDKQTNEIQDIMRHSIATEYSFHSKRDLTADEASLLRREAPSVQHTNQSYFMENKSVNNSNLSVGAYFQHRCPEFTKILGHTDSPERSVLSSAMPSISEVSSLEPVTLDMNKYKIDETLDCVPVRQSRNIEKSEKLNINNPIGKNYEKQSFQSFAISKDKNETYNKSELRYPDGNIVTIPEVPKFPKHLKPVTSSPFVHKPHVGTSKPTDILIRNLQTSMRIMTDDTQGSTENSLSISKIADYLGKQSNVSVSDMLQLNNHKKIHNKQPLTELHINVQDCKRDEFQVTYLRDSRKMETASSVGTVNTVISLDKLNLNEEVNVPSVVVTHHMTKDDGDEYKATKHDDDEYKAKRSTRSKSPSSKSQSTLSTVQENYASFKSGDSPLHTSKGEVNTSHVRSPNIEYRELDKSVDWHEVLQQKRLKQEGLAKEQWADISASAARGYVGVNCAVTITITTLTDNWLTAKFKFDDLPNDGRDLTIELPRLPLLLSPGKSEQFIVNITSNVEMDTNLPFTMFLKDASIEGDLEQRGGLDVKIEMPVIQAMSSDGLNKVTFPPIQENSSLIKSFVLISDCPCDLQLDLSITEGDSIFMIRSVQEIRKSDVGKVLIDRQGLTDDVQSKGKGKGINKQLCRLSSGNAICVTIKFHAPRIVEIKNDTINGALNVNLIGVNSILRKVNLVGSVGTVKLVVTMPANKLHLTNESTNLTVCNTGSISGGWCVKFMNSSNDTFPFTVAPSKFEIRPGAMRVISLSYVGPEDKVSEATIYFEDIATGNKTPIDVTGGTDKPKSFPIKTNHNIISWVRSGRKELNLKNSTEKKVHIRCQIHGEGFAIDVPGVETRDVFCLLFAPGECRPLPIIFSPNSNIPLAATLYLACDKNSDLSRKVKLFGCSSGDTVRWHGPVTYGETALVRCESREQVALQFYNKSYAPAFVSAQVHFNLQYNSIASTAYLIGNNTIIPPRAKHTIKLCVDWARVERRARDAATSALATVTCLTGAEITRRRILRVLRDNPSGEMDTSLLDNHLKVLAGQFDREDPNMEHILSEFKETKTSLNELIGGLQELTAQIVLPQDFTDENTIVITDDTMVEYHTLCD